MYAKTSFYRSSTRPLKGRPKSYHGCLSGGPPLRTVDVSVHTKPVPHPRLGKKDLKLLNTSRSTESKRKSVYRNLDPSVKSLQKQPKLRHHRTPERSRVLKVTGIYIRYLLKSRYLELKLKFSRIKSVVIHQIKITSLSTVCSVVVFFGRLFTKQKGSLTQKQS